MNMLGLGGIFQSTVILIAAYLAGASANADPNLRFKVDAIVPDPPQPPFTAVPTAMNNHGVVVGTVEEARPFKYHNGVMETLSYTLGGFPMSGGTPIDINDNGRSF